MSFKTTVGRIAKTIGLVRDHLMLVRIPLLLVAAGAVLATRVDQIAELFFLLGQSGESPRLQGACALAMAFALGVAVWYTARVLFRFRFPPRPLLADPSMAGLRKWLPRVLGAGIPLLMAVACLGQIVVMFRLRAFADIWWLWFYATIFLLEAALIFFAVIFRRRFSHAVAAKLVKRAAIANEPPSSTMRALASVQRDPADDRELHEFRDLEPFGRRLLIGGTLLNLVLLAAAWASPELLAWLGPIAIILLTALCFTLTGGLALIFTERHAVPIVTLIALLAIGLQALRINDNHHVRQTPAMASYRTADVAVSDKRPDAYAVLSRRLGESGNDPVFLVSAEGGGIRAAAWTALVLSRLEQQSHGRFGQRMIAGSGVSGGSLGLATYAAMLDLERRGKLAADDFACTANGADRCPARQFLTRDYLKPVLVNMLIVDQAQRWFPLAVLPDRGSVLERAWERGWRVSTSKLPEAGDAFAQSWRMLTGDGTADQPWLLLNSTIVDSGQRFIEQPLGIEHGKFDDLFPGATDGAARLGPDAPLSAVVHNSARFTYVSPAGTLDPPANHPELDALQLVDGGYFENSGTATLAGVYRLLTEAPATATPGFPVDRNRIYVIHLSNDPAVPSLLDNGKDSCPKIDADKSRAKHYGEIASPVFALLATREGRGEVARRSLMRTLPDDHFFHFRLCEGDHHVPLGWTLSSAAWDELDRQLGGTSDSKAKDDHIESNAAQMQCIVARLSGAECANTAH